VIAGFESPFVLIGGRRVATAEGFAVRSPWDGREAGRAGGATADQVRAALDGALRAEALPPLARAEILERAAAWYEAGVDEAAALITAESGICLRQARHEVERSVRALRSAAHQARRLAADDLAARYRVPGESAAARLEVMAEPVALAVGITPFNHPLNQVVHKVAPAVAAGAPLVLKPSEKTPLSAFRLAEVLLACGLPAAALSVVTGRPAAPLVAALVGHPGVELVSFTGSVAVGRRIARVMARSGNELVRYVPELGGSSALVVMDDADLPAAARMALGAFDNAGQRCTAVRRLLVHEAVAGEFTARFMEAARALRCGDPWDPETDLGPLIDEPAAVAVEERVAGALAGGARLLLGHRRLGALYPPTVLDGVTPGMDLVAQETFGPVAPILRIRSLEEAIAVTRANPRRLAGAIATASEETARCFAAAVKVGQLSWNGPPGYRTESAPFGGFGDSGNGEKEGIVHATRALLNLRTFWTHPLD
jgi:acyl-CoA reductase-like NAD-dependent aldehyde dehydrogenase